MQQRTAMSWGVMMPLLRTPVCRPRKAFEIVWYLNARTTISGINGTWKRAMYCAQEATMSGGGDGKAAQQHSSAGGRTTHEALEDLARVRARKLLERDHVRRIHDGELDEHLRVLGGERPDAESTRVSRGRRRASTVAHTTRQHLPSRGQRGRRACCR